jgi:hypothetical protein
VQHSLRRDLCLLIAGSSLLFGFARAAEPAAPTSLGVDATTVEAAAAAPDAANTAAEPTNAPLPEAGEPAGTEPTTDGATEVLKTKTRSNQSND